MVIIRVFGREKAPPDPSKFPKLKSTTEKLERLGGTQHIDIWNFFQKISPYRNSSNIIGQKTQTGL